MVLEGATVAEPDVAPPVVKSVLVHDDASVELHESVVLLPFTMLAGEAESAAVGAGPLSVTVSVIVFRPIEGNDFVGFASVLNTVPFSLHEYE